MGAAWRVGAVVGAMALLTGVLASSESSGTTTPAKTSFVAAAQVAVRPSAPGAFVSLAPSRLLDTRTGDGGAGPVAGSGTVHLQVAGRSGVPASGVSAVVMNVTVTAPTRTGYLTAYPDGTSRPNASNLNFVQGQTVANLVTVRLGSNGKVALTNVSRGSAQLVADVAGYYLVGTPPFVTSIAPSGHYFLDQYSDPILIKGDSPWIGFAAVSTTDWSAYLAARAAQGVNSLIVDAVAWNLIRGAGVPGSPDAYTAGQTYDGIHPFTNNDITTPNPTYWSRVDAMVAAARTYGITLFIYAVDNYQFGAGEVMNGVSDSSAVTLGRFLGNRYKNAPNIVWLFGNDYPPSAAPDSRMRSVLTGIRDAGDHHMFSASLMYHLSYTYDGATWTDADFWSVYTYPVQYDPMKRAYDHLPTRPAVMIEAAYIGESYTNGDAPLTIRKQIGWSLSQGGAGDFVGTEDWWFKSGWQTRLTRSEVVQAATLRSIFEAVEWWRLVPSTTFVTSGAGTRLTATNSNPGATDWPAANDYASSAVSADGTLAMVYLPTQRTIRVDSSRLTGSPVGTWVSATTGAQTAAGSLSGALTPPSAGDWVLRIKS
jgi:hypothetical protein